MDEKKCSNILTLCNANSNLKNELKLNYHLIGRLLGKFNGDTLCYNLKGELYQKCVWYMKVSLERDEANIVDKLVIRINSTLPTSLTSSQSLLLVPKSDGVMVSELNAPNNMVLSEILPNYINVVIRATPETDSEVIQIFTFIFAKEFNNNSDSVSITIQSFQDGIMKNTYFSYLNKVKED